MKLPHGRPSVRHEGHWGRHLEGSWGWGICQDIWGKLGGKLGGSRMEIERKGGGNWRESKAQFAGKHWGKLGEIGGKLVPIVKEIGKHNVFFNGVSKGKTPNTVCLKVFRKRQHKTSRPAPRRLRLVERHGKLPRGTRGRGGGWRPKNHAYLTCPGGGLRGGLSSILS